MTTGGGGATSAVVLVLALCASILLLADRLHRAARLHAEFTRKLVHALMGLAAASFPWFFREPLPVLLLCAAFAALLGGSRACARLQAVHGVARRTAGAVWFPVAVAVVFVAAAPRPAHYVIAILVLTLADPAAALVGRVYGAHRFRVGEGWKSVEGSLAFFVVAAATIGAGLASTTPLGPFAVTLWAALIGTLLAAVEAASPAGSDNVLVPVGALLLLRGAGA